MNFLPFLIANRLHLKKNQNYTILLTSILSKIGISISVFALIMSFSALNGFQILLNKKILSTLPHGIIQLPDKSFLTWRDVIRELKFFPGVVHAEPYIVTNGLLVAKNKIKTIEIKSFTNIKYLKNIFSSSYKKNNSIKRQYHNHEIIISSYLLRCLSMKKGDSINVIFLSKKGNYLYSQIRNFSLKIVDVFKSNGRLDSNIGYMHINFFKNFLQLDDNINKIELHMSDPFNADQIILNAAKKINKPLLVYTWINSYKYIYHNIKKIKIMVYLGLLLLVIISCFSIISISLITISKKTREIAILRSMGADDLIIQMTFLYYGLRSIIMGNLIGLLISVVTILNFEKIIIFLEKNFKNNILLDNIYCKSFFLLKINPLDIIVIFISIIIIGIITNVYPAYYASKINPSDVLKEY